MSQNDISGTSDPRKDKNILGTDWQINLQGSLRTSKAYIPEFALLDVLLDGVQPGLEVDLHLNRWHYDDDSINPILYATSFILQKHWAMDIQLTHTINPYNIYCPVFTFERFCMFVNFYQSFYQKVVTYLSIGPTRPFNNHVVQVTFIKKKDFMIQAKFKIVCLRVMKQI